MTYMSWMLSLLFVFYVGLTYLGMFGACLSAQEAWQRRHNGNYHPAVLDLILAVGVAIFGLAGTIGVMQ